MNAYVLRDDRGSEQAIEAADLPAAKAAAKAWARDGDYNLTPEDGTIWVHVAILEGLAGDEVVERVTVRIDPPAPRCARGQEHDWRAPYAIVGGCERNPGVRGHEGGVLIQEVCMRCGCERVTNTYAQDPATGERGLESVRYEAGKYADEVAS